jgi:pimeloyl-[acyl-carrier protein] methyl ester esterase
MSIELVFIHGWGFDTRFWDKLCAALPQFRHTRIDLGFFGATAPPPARESSKRILVGHSLGFVHGLRHYKDWAGWIAINGFTRFLKTAAEPGCMPAANLRALRMGLQNGTEKPLQDFYRSIDAPPLQGTPKIERLREGLDELQSIDTGALLGEQNLPGLALASRNDPLVPIDASEALGAKAKDFRLHDEAGHLLPLSDPAWCAAAMTEFLGSCFTVPEYE